MSKRRAEANPASLFLRRLDGARVNGGCDYCTAYHVVEASPYTNIHMISIYHDDWCPALIRMESRHARVG